MPPTTRHFKKYANRKFYDLDKGHYVSLLELAEVAAGGEDIEVICDRTGRDRTFEALTRALYERAKAYYAAATARAPAEDPIGRMAVLKIIRLIPKPAPKQSMKSKVR